MLELWLCGTTLCNVVCMPEFVGRCTMFYFAAVIVTEKTSQRQKGCEIAAGVW